MEFTDQLLKRKEYIDSIIKQSMPAEEGYQKLIMEAMSYSLMAGGKRIRPMLMLETYHLFGGKDDELLAPFMAAMEMIHTYSLVHDDLPAMDNDEYRRGRKTTHIVYGHAMGILAGDALLNYAFETMADGLTKLTNEDLVRGVKALQVIANKAGIYGMIGGQVVDVLATDQSIEKDRLDFIYELKTGALIEASILAGAILAGASNEIQQDMGQVASLIGMAFQIQDDVLDVTSTVEELGKPIHSDEKNNKTTYVTLLGVEGASQKVENYTLKGLAILKKYATESSFLYQLLKALVNRNK